MSCTSPLTTTSSLDSTDVASNVHFPTSRPPSHAANRGSATFGNKELVRIPSLSAFFREYESKSVSCSPANSRPGSAQFSRPNSARHSISSFSSDGPDMLSVSSVSQNNSRPGSRAGSARFGVRPFRCSSPTDRGVVDNPADSLIRRIKKTHSMDVPVNI